MMRVGERTAMTAYLRPSLSRPLSITPTPPTMSSCFGAMKALLDQSTERKDVEGDFRAIR